MVAHTPPHITITPASDVDRQAVLDVLARGMRDNPLHVAVFGGDISTRDRQFRKLLALRLGSDEFLQTISIARLPDSTIVGVYASAKPGACQPSFGQQIAMVPGLLRLGFGTMRRTLTWFGTWAKHDPKTPHWHFGPFAVDAHLQRQGIGSQLLQHFCDTLDAVGEDAYLETDRPENVGLYQRFGFTTVAEGPVVGVPCWYMLRKARPAPPGATGE